MSNYSYFDESYFERGEERGTAYQNYRESSKASLLFKEIAEACAAFRPRRALEIGCATGVLVRMLNEGGVEAHGIDVSEWAIRHREHKNVQLTGVEDLSFPDGHFDLVYSVHSLEHIPEGLKDRGFTEMARVSTGEAIHFHMLPMIGSGPYVGEPSEVIRSLRRDPTHNLLYGKDWWLSEFARIGFRETGGQVLFSEEVVPDLSASQLFLTNAPADRASDLALLKISGEINLSRLNGLLRKAEKARTGFYSPAANLVWQDLAIANDWADIEGNFGGEISSSTLITGVVSISAADALTLRFCLVTDDGSEADYTRVFEPGVSLFEITTDQLVSRKGSVLGKKRARWLFGGPGTAHVRAAFMISASG